MPLGFAQRRGPSRPTRRHLGQALGEDPARASPLGAAEPAGPDPERYGACQGKSASVRL